MVVDFRWRSGNVIATELMPTGSYTNLTELRSILSERGIQLTRSLGQNFLHDTNQLRRITDAGGLSPSCHVLEIGPGLGPLTERLLATGADLTCIETDRRLVQFLNERFPASDRFRILHADALDWIRRTRPDLGNTIVVSNLPYSVASPILVELAGLPTPPRRIVVMLQLEVARRLTATPSSQDYGILTLLLEATYSAELLFKVPRSCFFPEPNVDSAVVRLTLSDPLPVPTGDRPAFAHLIKLAFSQRRKMLPKLLRAAWTTDTIAAALAKAGIDPKARAETLNLKTFTQLLHALNSNQEEIFDIVNEQDEVIGKHPRSYVHKHGLSHRAVHVLAFNSRGDVFLQKRSMKKDCFPGTWDSSASGHLDSGEEYDACALRELKEEIGLTPIEPPRRLFKINSCPETGFEFCWVYEVHSEGPFQLHPDEIDEGAWFAPARITAWVEERPQDFASAFVMIWKKWLGTQP